MTYWNRQRVLFLSVGGSDQPLRSSLRECRPDHVVFVVSDGSDGSESSVAVVETLYEAEGCPKSHEILKVPPDDPDQALAKIEPKLTRTANSGAQITVDYTGGTKSMTSAMVLAATSCEGIRLQFMAGIRRSLDQVEDGTEQPLDIPTGLIGLSQSFRTLRELIGRRNYGAAHSMLREMDSSFNQLGRRVPRGWRRRVGEWKKWVAIFDEWDRFNHKDAWNKLQSGLESGEKHAVWFEKDGPQYLTGLQELAESRNSPSYELLEDLWLNAKRRASLGLHDDAIARLYRLMEACVQTRLKIDHGIDTANVRLKDLPPDLRRKHGNGDRSMCIKLPLSDSVELLKSLDPNDELHKVMETTPQGQAPEWQRDRNQSILAHGFTPLGPGHWRAAHSWFQQRSKILWKSRLPRFPYEQFPNRLPNF